MIPELDEVKYSLDHIGIAVESIDKGFSFYQNLGFKKMTQEEVPTEGVKVAMIELLNQCRIELLEPLHQDPSNPIYKYLEKRGSGIHHICLRVTEDLVPLANQLKQRGVQLINETPRIGAHNTLVIFIHPKSAGGVLVELSQKLGDNKG